MLAKRLLQKAKAVAVAVAQVNHSSLPPGALRPPHLDPRVTLHYGIPSTSSLLSFDPLQQLLAVATLDGRIKIIGGEGIEWILDSPIQLPCKFLEFMNNQGHLVSITNQNDIQVWDLNARALACYIQWESNITASAVIQGTSFIYLGDDLGNVAVVKYDQEERELSRMPYNIPMHIVQETSKDTDRFPSSVVGIFPQPSASDTRVLLAYENGLVILWDLYEARAIAVRGGANLKLKNDKAVASIGKEGDETSKIEEDESNEEKEICCACWASSDGSIFAVGYTDGDILMWSIPSGSCKDHQQEVSISSNKTVVKIQLSSSKRRIPVIVLRWCKSGKHNSECGGQLFVYGGDEIGSPEVVTVLDLKWTQGMASLICTSRLDIALYGSFADMILLPSAGSMLDNTSAALLVLTSPGHLHAYDEVSITKVSLSSEKDKFPVPPQPVSVQTPLAEPSITKAKLVLLPKNVNASKLLSQLPRCLKAIAPSNLPSGIKWPVAGGFIGSTTSDRSSNVEVIYISGHENGSVRVWDASVPFLCLLCSLENKTQSLTLIEGSAPISSLDFCPFSEILAVGDEQGKVRLYKLSDKSADVSCQVITEDIKQVHSLHWESGFQCIAVFSIHHSPICSFAFANATRICVASESGLVSVIDLHSLSILFHWKCSLNSTKIISASIKTVTSSKDLLASPTSPKSKRLSGKDATKEYGVVIVLTEDESVITIDCDSGAFLGSKSSHPKHQSSAVAFHIIDTAGLTQDGVTYTSEQDTRDGCDANKFENELNDSQEDIANETKMQAEVQELSENASSISGESLESLVLLLCSKDALCLYSVSSFIQGNNSTIRKVKLEIPCCWASTFVSNDVNASGLVLLYESGLLEIRSLPDMEVIGSISLSDLLRWKYHPNIVRTLSSSANGRIALVHNKEMAFLSILANENDLRIPDSLPCLHDRELAAATDAALKAVIHQKQKKNQIQGFLGGVIKEIKGGVLRNVSPERPVTQNTGPDLSDIFAWCPFPEPSAIQNDAGREVLDIDDIEIEEDLLVSSPSSSSPAKSGGFVDIQKAGLKDKESDRKKLLNEKQGEVKPRMRTPEEIKAAYGHRKAGDVSSVAGQAMSRLQERGHKLQAISKHTEELQAGAENFSSMADELLKTMEARKWWQI